MKYTIKSYLGGLQPGWSNQTNRCFGNAVIQMLYRATNIREHILQSTYTNQDINTIKKYLQQMKVIDEQTKENTHNPINDPKEICIWNLASKNINPKIPYGQFGTSTALLENILEDIKYDDYVKTNFYSNYEDWMFLNNSEQYQQINANPLMIIQSDTFKNTKYLFLEPLQSINNLVDEMNIDNNKYKLVSFYVNSGVHYFSYIQNPYQPIEWLEYNDSNITTYNNLSIVYNDCKKFLTNEELVRSSLLCYERIDKKQTVLELICTAIQK
jgi:hypothetical protein